MGLIICLRKSGSSCCFSCCWHTSGWNELASWFRLARHKRKKRRATKLKHHHHHHKCRSTTDLYHNHNQSAHKSSPPLPTRRMKITKLPPAILFTLLISFVCLILASIVHSQLMVDHPWRDGNRFQQHRLLNHSKSVLRRNRDDHRKPHQEPQDNNDIASYSTLPTSRDKQNELVRRLSSTMLLETLLKNPMPMSNKAPFPSLVLPRPLARPPVDPPYSLNIDTSNHHRPNRRRKNGDAKLKQRVTSQANAPKPKNSSISEEEKDEMEGSSLDKFIAESDLFNASSLNYLVEKLLNATPISKNEDRQKPLSLPPAPLTRPTNRKKVVQRKETGAEHVLPTELQALKSAHQTLDKLIKDEYDTRVRPMFKSLLEQQQSGLYDADEGRQKVRGKTKATTAHGDHSSPSNHKLEMSSSNFSSSTLSPLEDELAGQGPSPAVVNVSSSTADDQLVTIIPVEDLIPFAHFDDHDEHLKEFGDPSDQSSVASRHNATTTSEASSIKLQNVPPYQLGSSQLTAESSARPKPPKLFVPPEAYSPTTNPSRFSPPTAPSWPPPGSTQRPKKFHKGSGEKSAAGASARGSLVFSDGVGEASGKKRGQSSSAPNERRATTASSMRNSSLSSPPSLATRRKESKHTFGSDTSLFDRPKESFLLNQLFSTVNPLRDLDLKLREQYNNRDQTMQHPLVYKGYVGRDDTSLQNGVDWSRPIGLGGHDYGAGQREMTTTSRYSPAPTLISSPAPPTAPPSFYLSSRQPVTSAQAVPNMVIPTSDPPHLTTTPSPLTVSSYSIPYPASGPPPSLFTPPARGDEIRYSYQLPDRSPVAPKNSTGAEFSLPTKSISEVIRLKPVQNETGSGRNLSTSVEDSLSALWSPTKLNNETVGAATLMKRKEQHDGGNATTVASSAPSQQQQQQQNSSSPHMVSIVSSKGMPISTTTTARHNQTQPDDHKSRRQHQHQGASHAAHGRNKSKSRNQNEDVSSSDEQEEGDNEEAGEHQVELSSNNRTKTKLSMDNFRPRRPSTRRPEKDPGDDEEDSSEKGGHSEGDEGEEDGVTEAAPKKRKKAGKFSRKNQTRSQFESHVEAGSEIQLTGLPGNERGRNQSVNLYKNLPKAATSEADSGSGPSTTSTSTSTSTLPTSHTSPTSSSTSSSSSSAAPATSYGSTIIPTNNFYGEASSESPTLDNPISVLNSNLLNNNKMNRNAASGVTTEDPLQRAVQRGMSAAGTKLAPTLQPSTVADNSAPGSSSAKPPLPAQKSSRDPLAFILIGGSCALSVVCLVLAAMSMRCQDMCDDYRTLRNAERAALKLQKHRLKYTKSHQINRLSSNSNGSSNNNHNNLLDELLGEQQHQQQKRLDDPDGFIEAWSSPTAATFLGSKSSDLSCRCATCSGRQCSCLASEEGGKRISWLHQCCQQQPMTRASNNNGNRPPFGAGSSVGTFFPASRRPDEHFLVAGGPQDAQLLIDSCQPSSAPAVSRSKSILHNLAAGKGRKMVYPMMGAKSSALSLDQGEHFGAAACGNPEHSHHSHHHHHSHCSQHQPSQHHQHRRPHHHHQHCARYNQPGDSSAGEESKLTLDEESVLHCCEAGAKCHHHRAIDASLGLSNRLKLLQLRSAASSHQHSAGWRQQGESRANQHRHHHHHHQHQHQPQQVSNSSEASSLAQCTCSQDSQPLIGSSSSNKLRPSQSHHRPASHHQSKLGQALASKQAKRDKAAMLVWSTNRDRLI